MSAAVGGALKKILTAVLTEPKVLKNILFAVLVVVVAMLLPTVFVVTVFSGDFEIDAGSLLRYVEANLSAEDIQLLQALESTMTEIENAMTDTELGSKVTDAQVLYIMALSDDAGQPGFVSRLVACFGAAQTDAQLIANVNAAFGTNIAVQDFTHVMGNIRSRQIDVSGYTDPSTKNNLDLVAWAIQAEKAGWGYVWGTYGKVLTPVLLEAKLQQYPQELEKHEDFIRANWVGKRTADCIGLIKGYSWYNTETGEILYASNGMPDVSADQIFADAPEKGAMDTMPEIPGLILYMHSHVGIYIGDGFAIEARGTRYGVVKTRVASRSWTGWCKNPYIIYVEEAEDP